MGDGAGEKSEGVNEKKKSIKYPQIDQGIYKIEHVYTYTHSRQRTQSCKRVCQYEDSLTLSFSLSLSHTHVYKCAQACSQSHTQTNAYTRVHTHTYTYFD